MFFACRPALVFLVKFKFTVKGGCISETEVLVSWKQLNIGALTGMLYFFVVAPVLGQALTFIHKKKCWYLFGFIILSSCVTMVVVIFSSFGVGTLQGMWGFSALESMTPAVEAQA